MLHHPEASLESLCHVDRWTFRIAVDVGVHALPPPEILPLLQSVVPKAKVLQLALVDLVFLGGTPCNISARDTCQRSAKVADREGDSLLLLVKPNVVRPQHLFCEPSFDEPYRALLVQTKDLLRQGVGRLEKPLCLCEILLLLNRCQMWP